MDVHLDWRVLAFTLGLSVLTGLIFGLAPAFQSSRTVLAEPLKSGGRGATLSVSQRLRSSLATAEVGFAALLIIAAGLLIRSFWALTHVNPGFQAEHIITARITPNESFCSDTERCLTFYRSLLDQVQASPGVSGAAVVNTLPLGGRVAKRSVSIENFVSPTGGMVSPLFWMNTVSPEYFHVMNVPLLSGRSFSTAEMSGNPPVAIVNAETARRAKAVVAEIERRQAEERLQATLAQSRTDRSVSTMPSVMIGRPANVSLLVTMRGFVQRQY